MFKKKKIKSDYITSELNSFKNECDKKSKKKRLTILRKTKPETVYNFEENRLEYCKTVNKLYNEAFENNDIETLRDRQLRLLHYTEISNNIIIGVGGGLAVGQISSAFLIFNVLEPTEISPIVIIFFAFIISLIFVLVVIWLLFNLFDLMLAGYKSDNMFGTLSWEIKFLDEKLCKKTQIAIEEMILEDLVKKGASKTIADYAKQTDNKPIEQNDNGGISL